MMKRGEVFVLLLALGSLKDMARASDSECSEGFQSAPDDYDYYTEICVVDKSEKPWNVIDVDQEASVRLEEGDKVLLVSPIYGCAYYPQGPYKCTINFENVSGGKIKYSVVKMDLQRSGGACNKFSDQLIVNNVVRPRGQKRLALCGSKRNKPKVVSRGAESKVTFRVNNWYTSTGFEILIEALA